MEELQLRPEGHTFVDDELEEFFTYFYTCLQYRLKRVRGKQPKLARELSEASTILGKPRSLSKTSASSTNFRNDLKIVCEAAGIGGCSVVLSDDSRFIDTVIESEEVKKCFKKAVRSVLNIKFSVRVVPLCSVVNF